MNSRALALGLLLGLAACASALLDEPAASAEEVSASVPPQESEPGNFGVDVRARGAATGPPPPAWLPARQRLTVSRRAVLYELLVREEGGERL